MLRALGPIIETSIIENVEPQASATSDIHYRPKYRLVVRVYDWEAQRQWWWDSLVGTFPTSVQLQWVELELFPRKHSHSHTILYKRSVYTFKQRNIKITSGAMGGLAGIDLPEEAVPR